MTIDDKIKQCRENHSGQVGHLLNEIDQLRAALSSLLPGYEQYLEWAKERRVLFLKDGYAVLEKAREALTTK